MKSTSRILLLGWSVLALAAARCSAVDTATVDSGTVSTIEEPTATAPRGADAPSQSDASESSVGLTYHRPDGNRLVAGHGNLLSIKPLDIELSGQPLWLVAAPMESGSLWVAILADGKAEAFHVVGAAIERITLEPPALPPGAPPKLIVADGIPKLLPNTVEDASRLTHPVQLSSPIGETASVATSGDLRIVRGGEIIDLPVNALPDARLLVDEFDRILLLSDPTSQYGHGVLGDSIEAGGFTLIESQPVPRITAMLKIDPAQVIEGIAPIWTDINGDGTREIIVTESSEQQGAQIVAYTEQGARLASGPAIGIGFRWRHQLAVAPFGPNGELELASVRTPHIGGIVEFYQLIGDELEIMAEFAGYSSHRLGSRNLDSALAGDFDGDGRIELLVPDQAQEVLGAVQRNKDDAETIWTLPLGGVLSSNLAAVSLPEGTIALGAGREDNTLRLWLP